MNQLFLGNSRILLFKPDSSTAPATRTATRVWYGDDENVYTDYEIQGNIYGNDLEETPTSQITNVASAKKIEIGSTVTSIGEAAFYRCYDLTSVTIPNSVMSIGAEAFKDCHLTSVTIPDSVTSIGSIAFLYCRRLTSVTFEGKDRATVQGMSDYPFGLNQGADLVTIYCSDGNLQVENL